MINIRGIKRDNMISFLRQNRLFSILAHDMLMAFASVYIAFYLRLGESFVTDAIDYTPYLLLFPCVALITHLIFKTHKTVWSYSSVNDLIAIAKTASTSVLGYVSILFLINRLEMMPRSVFLIHLIIYIFLLGGSRLCYRLAREKRFSLSPPNDPTRTIPLILFGLNKQAELFIRYLHNRMESDYATVAIIDTKGDYAGSRIFNIPIYSSNCSFQHILHDLNKKGIYPQKVIITNEHEDGSTIRHILDEIDHFGITLARLPRLIDFHSTEDINLELRPIALEDLLGRPQQVLDRQSMREFIRDKRILITGCGGTIGSELSRQIAAFHPAHMVLLDNCEFNLYKIDQEIQHHYPQLSKSPILGDIKNKKHLNHVFDQERPDIVFHAAAIKHVPLSECNVIEASHTNIIGTMNVADTCIKHHVSTMIMISTDKAVNPSSFMGKTKRIAEYYIQSLLKQSSKTLTTRFATVRFGNVIGSSGSVIPLFQEQIKQGGPITITHQHMTRYFMTVREAVELILQASAFDHDGVLHNNIIYVLDMGEPVLIKDLAIQMIRMSGLRPEEDIALTYTGLRPGEKMHEELFYSAEKQTPTKYKNIMIADPIPTHETHLKTHISHLEEAIQCFHRDRLITIVDAIIDEANGKLHPIKEMADEDEDEVILV